jgi:16S rRNA (guanine527-N7)-methyltransferase
MSLEPLGRAWSGRIERVLHTFLPSGSAELEASTTPRFCDFLDLVVTWNARTDLTAARDADELVDLFLADAALIAACTPAGLQQSWLDVGSGAGAPGLPLAMLRSDLTLKLIEPRQRRVAFLRTAVGALSCANVTVQRARSDELPDQVCDLAVSRATLPPEEWLAEGARLARRGIWVLLARASEPQLEGWQIQDDRRYSWPLTGAERHALLFVQK